MFWGDSDPVRGASSLRNALSVLKKDLSGLDDELITSDVHDVRLDIGRLWIDVVHYASPGGDDLLRQTLGQRLPDLIEGLNVRATGNEMFEDWLRLERQHWINVLEPLLEPPQERERIDPPLRDPARSALPDLQGHFSIGLLPTISRADAPHAGLFGDSIMDSIADNLRALHLAEIYDYRMDNLARFETSKGTGPSILLQLKLFQDSSRINLTLLVYRTSQQRLLWTWPLAARFADGMNFDNLAVANFINRGTDRVSKTLQDLAVEAGGAYRNTPYHALVSMFRLENAALGDTRQMLVDALAETGESVHRALLAYLNTFHVGEHWGRYDGAVVDDTREQIFSVLNEDPFNAVTLTMAGHAAGYVLHDPVLSGEMLQRAVELNPTLALAWDHLALHHMYNARYDLALNASETAIRLGVFSPLRFTYDTTMCMISTLRGDYPRAVEFGSRALAHRPKFGAALRYMSVALAHLGQDEEAFRLVSRIRKMAPDFSGEWVMHNRLAVNDDRARRLLLTGFQRAGA